ncbi:MAG: hypothetical protein KDN19_00735 [Verrucomicrobiae bacterium]|nr:hypothetical protein [Verrucomicrobiae bacterium]
MERTWAIAFAIFVIALHFGVISYNRDYAFWKAEQREFFLLQNEKTDHAIEVLRNDRAFRFFSLGTVILLTLIPILFQKLRLRLWITFLIVFALYLPGFWYGIQIVRVSGKLIDWPALLHPEETKPTIEGTTTD